MLNLNQVALVENLSSLLNKAPNLEKLQGLCARKRFGGHNARIECSQLDSSALSCLTSLIISLANECTARAARIIVEKSCETLRELELHVSYPGDTENFLALVTSCQSKLEYLKVQLARGENSLENPVIWNHLLAGLVIHHKLKLRHLQKMEISMIYVQKPDGKILNTLKKLFPKNVKVESTEWMGVTSKNSYDYNEVMLEHKLKNAHPTGSPRPSLPGPIRPGPGSIRHVSGSVRPSCYLAVFRREHYITNVVNSRALK
eukprot:TRINITY_DN37133_c0_g1_i1.p1 TRINITY_DN37133_c0_g1~~TRINITY_DN37133_c0_g1_i1.p1  ORF type:complete len:279 (-),score=49.38 TRINITY_DN37133_c0_g1_i1:223-1002(-)